jgi:hypothetical protein
MTDNRTFGQKFKDNLQYIWAYSTAWVSTIWFGALAYWGSMDRGSQIELVGDYFPRGAVSAILALLAVVSFIAAKGWPQPKLAAKVDANKVASQLENLH